MPVNKTGTMMKLEGAPLQALYDKVEAQAEELRKADNSQTGRGEAIRDKVAELEKQIVGLKQMVETQLQEIAELQSAAGAIERNPPPNEVADEMNSEMQDNPIGTSAIEMTAPEEDIPPDGPPVRGPCEETEATPEDPWVD